MKVLLGISSSIAAFKSIDILRYLLKEGVEVQCIMTRNSVNLISPLTLEILSGKKVIIDLFEKGERSEIVHIEITKGADLLLVAPATANIIAKFANGIADDALSTIFLASRSPVLIAPAMHTQMYLHPVTQKNIEKLKSIGVEFIGPYEGELASGERGIGRMAEPEEIVEKAVRMIMKKTLKGKKFLVTAGPTYERIDPVRIITNPSSGKMGYALAEEILRRGGDVILISGPTHLQPPIGADIIMVESTEEMKNEVIKNLEKVDAVIMASAPADFKPKISLSQKAKKESIQYLELERTPDILEEIKERKGKKLVVGFSAETSDVVENAKKKMISKGMDVVVANDVSKKGIGFGSDLNEVIIIDKEERILSTGIKRKKEIAKIILDFIENKLSN
jgi:phosphopantothenoylcysteine decarboxylase/phosphopantothenate--cysteine ligase